MKRIILLISVLTVLVSCTKEYLPNGRKLVGMEFHASLEQATKTSMEEETGKVDWVKNDTVSYYSASDGAVRKVSVPEDSHTFSFTAQVGQDDTFIIASYGGTITNPQGKSMALMTEAAMAEQSGKFEDAHVAVSKRYLDNGNNLNFKNITSLVKFSLDRDDIASVAFTASDGTIIHGNGKICFTFDGEAISASYASGEGGCTIKVNTDGTGTYYISMLPCVVKGFTQKYYNDEGKVIGMSSTSKTLAIGASTIVDLGTLDSKIGPVSSVDLSDKGTANCYIAADPGVPHRFKATVKGGSNESVGMPKKAKVLWESFGTDVTPEVGDVVSEVSLDGDCVKFVPGQNGNAVIGVTDMDGDLLWSWHIWVCSGYNPEATAQTYNNDAGIVMDRNLGATSAAPGNVHSLGLLYQWGRKDPFIGSSSISEAKRAASTLSWPLPVSSDAQNGTIDYAVTHPTTFITCESNNYDWYYTGTIYTDHTRWQTSDEDKGIYDPCPYGWRVPDGGEDGLWIEAFGTRENLLYPSNWDSANRGMDFGKTELTLGKGTIWYPAVYSLFFSNGYFDINTKGRYWSCTPMSNESFGLSFLPSGIVCLYISFSHAYGLSVRCLKDLR